MTCLPGSRREDWDARRFELLRGACRFWFPWGLDFPLVLWDLDGLEGKQPMVKLESSF